MGYIAFFGYKGNAWNILGRKPAGKRLLKRHRSNIRVLLRQ
jgi:hypothetical protein